MKNRDEVLAYVRSCRWVDLTHAFEPGIPHYAAFPDERRRVVTDFADGFLSHEYCHSGQWGTHRDPPLHFVEGGRASDEIPVTEMLLPSAGGDRHPARLQADAQTASPAAPAVFERTAPSRL